MAKVYDALATEAAKFRQQPSIGVFDGKSYSSVNIFRDLGQTYPRLGLPDNSWIPGIETTSNVNDISVKNNSKYPEAQRDMSRYLAAFGTPPVFDPTVDPRYPLNANLRDNEYGRVYGNTILSNPTLLSLCPGSVTYLSSLASKDDRENLFNMVLEAAGKSTPLGQKISGEEGGALSGKLFSFKAAYPEYISIVNLLCRTCALMLGLDKKSIWNPNKYYKDADYGYLTSSAAYKSKSNEKNPWAETMSAIYTNFNSSAHDDAWVNFFITHQGTSLREDASVTTGESELEKAVGQGNVLANNLSFLFGRNIGGDMNGSSSLEDDLASILDVGDNGSFLGDVTKLLKNYLKGGKLIIPKMIENFNYEKSLSCTLKLTSIYGDKEAIFTRCLVPIAFLLAMVIPKQIADNMYTFPFVVKAFQRGWFNSDLAVITNLSITKGGQDDTAWTVDGLATEYEVSFDIVPLVQNLMVTSANNPFLFMKNEALIDYLGCMCGLDTRADFYKGGIALQMIKNKIFDIPMNIQRSVSSWAADSVTNIFRALDVGNIFKRR